VYEDGHNVAIEMHNDFINNVASMERIPLKAISVAKLIFELQLCISIAYNTLYLGMEKASIARL
jgi:hypothetical protein